MRYPLTINDKTLDSIRIETVKGKTQLLHKLVLYLIKNHVDADTGDRRKFVIMKSENRESICTVWRQIIDRMNDVVIQIDTPTI